MQLLLVSSYIMLNSAVSTLFVWVPLAAQKSFCIVYFMKRDSNPP